MSYISVHIIIYVYIIFTVVLPSAGSKGWLLLNFLLLP